MSKEKREEIQRIQVISRAANILRVLGKDTSGLSLGQIAGRVGLPRSTVQRIVGALASEGFLTAGQGNGGIRLGPEIQSLAQSAVELPRERLRPVLQTIADETGETVDLARLDGKKMLFIDQIVGQQRLRAVSSIGDVFPLTTTANGKAALARLPEGEAEELMAAECASGLSGKSLAVLMAEIDGIRNGALARDEDEHTDGISAIGIGLNDPSGDVFAISVPVPSSRYGRIKDTLISSLNRARDGLSS